MKSLFTCLLILYSSAVANEFTLITTKAENNNLSIGQVVIGREYLIKASFTAKLSGKIKSFIPSCSCVEILSLPKDVSSAKPFEAMMKIKTLKPRQFSISLDLVLANNKKESYKLFGESSKSLDDSEYVNPRLIQIRKAAINPRFYIDSKKVLANTKKYTLIDLRDESNFFKARIPTSFKMSSLEIQSSEFLRKKTIVLVSSPVYSKSLENTCLKLRSMGFRNTFLLKGGLNSWVKAGGTLTGVGKPEVKNSISVVESFDAAKFKETILVSSVDSDLIMGLQKAENVKPSTQDIVLCFDQKSFERVSKNTNTLAFNVEGGLEAYKKFLIKSSKMLSPQEILRQQQTSDCQGCP